MTDEEIKNLPEHLRALTEEYISILEGHRPHAAQGPTADPDVVEDLARPVHLLVPPPFQPVMPTLHVDADGWLVATGTDVHLLRVPSKRTQALVRAPSAPPGVDAHVDGITWHWTDTPHGTGARLAQANADLPKPGQHVGSWHACIDGDGTIYQAASFRRGTWHAGGPTAARLQWDPVAQGWAERYPPPPHSTLPTANSVFAGVELVCVGEVRWVGGQWLGWPFGVHEETHGRSARVDGHQVEERVWRGRKRHFQRFTPAQILSAERLTHALVDAYDLPAESVSYGHTQLDPDRREDPGPLWLEEILPEMLGRVFGEH